MNPFFLFVIIILIILIATVCANLIFAMKRRKYLYAKKLIAPPWADVETKKLFKQFNDAWSITIEKTVNVRVTKARRTLTDSELRERWHELKKFLFLAGISKGLPMFSKKVDDLWHFFLEEKELYEQFCFAFIGEQIEHHPHETLKKLPTERAWFDILYLSFFNITSHAHLWGKFVQKKKAHVQWVAQIIEDPDTIIKSFGRSTSSTESVQTLNAFLQFAREQLNEPPEKRVRRRDGYWYGAALFSLHSDAPIQEKKKKGYDAAYADGSFGFAASAEPKEEWNEMVTNVNTFEVGTDGGSTPGTSSDSGGSDSSSSCSSCSGCSS